MENSTPQSSSNNQTAKTKMSKNRFRSLIAAIIGGVLIVGGIVLIFTQDTFISRPNYVKAYSLVNDTISQSANIQVFLPDGMSKEEGLESISFTPKVDGEWVATEDTSTLLYAPKKELDLGKYYTVTLNSEAGTIGKDFLVSENPEVSAVFPHADTETHEDSDVTIVFNRPMVPLTSLDVLEKKDLPISISPQTEGKFKWIGTRTLQFIPETTLVSSANYQVNINSDFVSMDGLSIAGIEHRFTTRKLRVNSVHEGLTIYNQPISIRFNQPVDFSRTIKEISLRNTTEEKEVAFTAEFAKKKIYNKEKDSEEEVDDDSTILIYNKQDRHGRKKLWDFTNNYQLNINNAYPIAGGINLDEQREVHIQVTNIVQSITASSERTNFARPDFFDPQGKIWIEFYEEIDLGKSKIEAPDVSDIGYGEKCEGEDAYYGDADCPKTDDKKKIYVDFDESKIGYSHQFQLVLKKIKNLDNVQLNHSDISENITSTPKLELFKTSSDLASGASLTEITLCTNSPLVTPKKEDIDSYLKVDQDYQFNRWNNSYRVSNNDQFCANNTFATTISYGLMPQTDYNLELGLVDHFGQEISKKVSFRTGDMPDQHLNFFHFQKEYTITTPDKTRLTYAAENMEFVDIHVCQLSASHMLNYLENKPKYDQAPTSLTNCTQTVSGRIELEKRYWLKNYFKVELKDYIADEFGHYIVTFSHPEYHTDNNSPIFERTFVTVTNLGVVQKKVNVQNENLNKDQLSELKNLYWVTNLKTLDPLPGVLVEMITPDSTVVQSQAYTDGNGIAQVSPFQNLGGAIAYNGSDSALVGERSNNLLDASNAYATSRAYMYTDRPLYRPGHEVNIKGIYRLGYDGSYTILNGEKTNVQVFDSNSEEIFSQEVTLNEFGTFDVTLQLDSQAPLGGYRVEAFDNYAFFDVEEYVPAAFKVDATADKDEYIAGDTLNLDIDAEYYFGAPVEGGEVTYSITSQNYYFDKYEGEYFNFGSGWYSCYYDCDYGDKYILRNKVDLNKDGNARISQALDFTTFFKEESDRKSKIFVLNITVTNSNGQAVSTQKSLIVHQGDFYLGVKTDKYFLGKDENFTTRVKSVDTQGLATKVKNIELTINKVKWVRNKRKEVDGGYYYRYEKQLEQLQKKTIDTDGSGDWAEDFSIDQEGQFEIVLKATDSRKNVITNTYSIYVWGEGYSDVRPSNDNSVEIITDKNSLEVGEDASIIIKSPYERAKALISIERGQIFSYEIVDINQSLYNYSFKIDEAHIPNVYASAVLISPDPEVRYGKIKFEVNNKEKVLNVEVKTDKTHYLPGEEVVLDLVAKNSSDQGVETELSVAVADLSVLALKGNPKKNPAVFFYSGFPLAVSTSSNIKNILYEVDVDGSTKGGGGSQPADLAKKKRGEFKDTAFWQAVVRTNAAGVAQVRFRLPDNLTTWQIESLGITKDTKLGVDYQEFIARKELMVVPLKPRFTIPGDEFFIGAKVFNQTDKSQKLDVHFASETLTLNDKADKTIKLDAGETSTIYYSVIAPSQQQNGVHRFEVSAKNSAYEDTVENVIKITRNDTYEVTATSNYTTENVANEYIYLPDNVIKDKGELVINHSATLAVFLSDALNSLLSYTYGCSEQIASKLDAIAIVKRGLNLENIGDKFDIQDVEFDGKLYTIDEIVDIGLARLYQNQNFDGGFSYYVNGDSSPYLTLHIITVLKDLEQAGYVINNTTIDRAVSYINSEIRNTERLQYNDFIILAAYTLTKDQPSASLDSYLYSRITQLINDDKFINEDISNESLSYLAILLTDANLGFGTQQKDKVFKILENRMEIDSRGAFLPTGNTVLWQFYETKTKNTSLLLKALVADERDTVVTDRILRWLLRSRAKDGAWGSTNNTISVIDAFTDYLSWKQENESNFDLTVLLGGEEKGSFTYEPATILDQNSIVTPIGEIPFGKITNLTFNKTNLNELENTLYYDLSLKYYLPIESISPRDEGFAITRAFYGIDDEDNETPLSEAVVGDVLRGHLEIIVPKYRNFVAVEDFIPAGVELVNFNLATEDQSLRDDNYYYDDFRWNDPNPVRKYYPQVQELRDDRIFMYNYGLSSGVYEYDYYVRVLVPGKFHHLPAMVSEMYTPENFGRTNGNFFTVNQD